jgi:hypothetical protein
MSGNRHGALLAAVLSAVVSLAAADAAPPAAPSAPAAGSSATTDSAEGAQARIPFANHGGIYNWQVVDDRTVLIQSQSRRWYKATLFSPCFELPFAQRLGFAANADGSFDKFSAIKVRRQNCPLASLVETAAPAKKPKTKKVDVTTAAPAAIPAAPAK